MTSAAARPRLSGPGELVAALPLLCGFTPAESLVLVCLEGAGSRVDLVARYDLPPAPGELLLADDVARTLLRARVQRAHAVIVTGEEGERPRAGLVDALQALPVDLLDVLLVRDGRWWSYLCSDPACCPAEGTRVPASSSALELVRARSVLAGRAVLPDREALVASLSAPQPDPEALQEAGRRLAEEVLAVGRPAVRRRLAAALDAALDDPTAGDPLELALSLHDVALRDEVLTWSRHRGEELLHLLLVLARHVAAPHDAPVCTCLAFVAWGRGDGATAGVALDRALGTDPGYRLARLLRQALDRQVRPAALRAVAVRAATGLRREGTGRGRR